MFKKQAESFKKLKERHISESERIRKQQKGDLSTLKGAHDLAKTKEEQRCKQVCVSLMVVYW